METDEYIKSLNETLIESKQDLVDTSFALFVLFFIFSLGIGVPIAIITYKTTMLFIITPSLFMMTCLFFLFQYFKTKKELLNLKRKQLKQKD